jgi:hypothetical protein
MVVEASLARRSVPGVAEPVAKRLVERVSLLFMSSAGKALVQA